MQLYQMPSTEQERKGSPFQSRPQYMRGAYQIVSSQEITFEQLYIHLPLIPILKQGANGYNDNDNNV